MGAAGRSWGLAATEWRAATAARHGGRAAVRSLAGPGAPYRSACGRGGAGGAGGGGRGCRCARWKCMCACLARYAPHGVYFRRELPDADPLPC